MVLQIISKLLIKVSQNYAVATTKKNNSPVSSTSKVQNGGWRSMKSDVDSCKLPDNVLDICLCIVTLELI